MKGISLRSMAQATRARAKKASDDTTRTSAIHDVESDDSDEEPLSLLRSSAMFSLTGSANTLRTRTDHDGIRRSDGQFSSFTEESPLSTILEEEPSIHTKDSMKEAQVVLADKLSLSLPMDELSSKSVNSDILLDMVEYSIEELENGLQRTEHEMESIQQRFSSIVTKTRKLEHTASVIAGKLSSLDDWMESIDMDANNTSMYIGMQTIELLIGMFSIVATLFSLLWTKVKKLGNGK